MSVRIKIAEAAEERDALFRARHRVYVEQGEYMPPLSDARICDRFDAFPTTTNLIVVDGDEVVGGVRLTEQGPAGLPAEQYFDFTSYLPPERGGVGSASMLCLEQSHRHQKRLIPSLGGMLYALAIQPGLTHLVAACNPEVEGAMRASGYGRVAPMFRHASGLTWCRCCSICAGSRIAWPCCCAGTAGRWSGRAGSEPCTRPAIP